MMIFHLYFRHSYTFAAAYKLVIQRLIVWKVKERHLLVGGVARHTVEDGGSHEPEAVQVYVRGELVFGEVVEAGSAGYLYHHLVYVSNHGIRHSLQARAQRLSTDECMKV